MMHRLRLGLIAGAIASSTATVPYAALAKESGASSGLADTAKTRVASRKIRLDLSSLEQAANAPLANGTIRFKVQLPEGGETVFTLKDSGVLPPELAARFPSIRSFKGFDESGRELRLDISELGVHGVVFDDQGEWSIQPETTAARSSAGDGDYLVQRTASYPRPVGVFPWNALPKPRRDAKVNGVSLPIDNHHREYRLAVAATSAYTQFFGGSVSRGLASVVESINRVNAVFERDLGIHLTLVKDNDRIIFVDPATDPYIDRSGNNEDDFARSQNTATLNRLIGSENFDVGHVVVLEAEGQAEDAAVCGDEKADAASGLVPASDGPAGLTKDFIDTLIHEIGHQFAADHTFNGCATEANARYEPGSGSTIMSYAGECFALDSGGVLLPNPLHNLQDEKDAYFHGKSIEEVRAFIAGHAATCGITRPNPSRPPVISPVPDSENSVPFIPARTPFYLDAQAVSPNPAARLTYVWEQIDLGPKQENDDVLHDKGQGPLFRSFPPSPSGTRVFPRLAAVLGEEDIRPGEAFPETTRELNFRLTVRDNLGEHASTASIDRKIRVVDTGSAFAVTAPSAQDRWRMGRHQFVHWNVAGTTRGPIACRNVRIDLSIDGGHTYLNEPLLASAPNTGRAWIRVPQLSGEQSKTRVRVGCNGNVFFAVSPGDFRIVR